ncbi:hypothetical protein COCOBI_18-0460 [Coccomyxa sp. Obi]|nr:hypothetical protein COCOBI_18-0460 [Coccomyxa sp. Obi]
MEMNAAPRLTFLDWRTMLHVNNWATQQSSAETKVTRSTTACLVAQATGAVPSCHCNNVPGLVGYRSTSDEV